MGAASVLNGLCGEEEASVRVDSGSIKRAILWVGGRGSRGTNVFEEEDDAVDWTVKVPCQRQRLEDLDSTQSLGDSELGGETPTITLPQCSNTIRVQLDQLFELDILDA